MADGEVRRGAPEGLRRRPESLHGTGGLLPVLQPPEALSGLGQLDTGRGVPPVAASSGGGTIRKEVFTGDRSATGRNAEALTQLGANSVQMTGSTSALPSADKKI